MHNDYDSSHIIRIRHPASPSVRLETVEDAVEIIVADDSISLNNVSSSAATATSDSYDEYEEEFRDKMIEAGVPVEKE